MVRLVIALRAASSRTAQSLLDALRFLLRGMRFDQACIETSAWMEPDGTVRYTELWATEEDMRRRVRSAEFTSLLSLLESAQEASVQFDFVTASRGLDYVFEARAETET